MKRKKLINEKVNEIKGKGKKKENERKTTKKLD